MPSILASFAALTLLTVVQAERPPAVDVTWHAEYQQIARRDQSLELGDSAHDLSLENGWRCAISATSKQSLDNESRITSCAKGTEILEFTVQCEPNRPRDHVQLRFKDASGKILDFIEVRCALSVPR